MGTVIINHIKSDVKLETLRRTISVLNKTYCFDALHLKW